MTVCSQWRFPLSAGAALAVMTMIAPTAAAQSTAPTSIMKACWVEGSGVIYRRDTTGAPVGCQQATHRAIEWTLGLIPMAPGGLTAVPVPLSLLGTEGGAILNLTNAGTGQAIFATSSGTTATALFQRTTGTGPTVRMVNSATGDGVGTVLRAEGAGVNVTSEFTNTGTAGAISARSTSENQATIYALNSATSGGSGLYVENKGVFTTADFRNTGAAGGGALLARASSSTRATAAIYNDGTGDALYTESNGGNPTFTARNRNITNGFAFRALSLSTIATGEFRNQGAVGGALFAESNGPNNTVSAVNSGTGVVFRGAGNASFTVAEMRNNSTSSGHALWAENKSGATTIRAINSGTANGGAIQGESQGTVTTGEFKNTGTGGALYLEAVNPSITTLNVNARNGASAIFATSSNQNAVFIENTGTGQNIAIAATAKGVWPTAQFQNTSTGPALRTFGWSDLIGFLKVQGSAQVDGNLQINGNYVATGTKNAVVPTSTGTREMYTEEATEVWFADYGQATLTDSVVWVPFDATFAETIESDRQYHVFLQAYADASIFVSRRTSEGFEVRVRGDRTNTQAIDFSYRLVAKRRGYGDRRLQPHNLDALSKLTPSGQNK